MTDDHDDAMDPLPSTGLLLTPASWISWSLAFVEGWMFSRESARLLMGLPFIVAMAGAAGFLCWLLQTPDAAMIAQIERAISSAEAASDLVRIEQGLQALVNLRPTEPEFRLRLGRFLVENERPDGLTHILALTSEQSDGYASARLWLVRQALTPAPMLRLEDRQIEPQLLKVLHQWPKHAETERLLAELYVRQSEWTLAEKHLTSALQTYPVLSVPLARVKRMLQRPQEDIQQLLDHGVAELLNRLTADRNNHAVRIALAETLSMLGRQSEAHLLLTSGVQDGSSPIELQTALSDFEIQWAAQKLQLSVLNMEASLQTIRQVIARQPGHPALLTELPRLKSAGAQLTRQEIQACLEFWSTAAADMQRSEDQRQQAVLAVGQLLSVVGEFQQAVQTLRPLITGRPALRLPFAELLVRTGDVDEARKLIDQIVLEQQTILRTTPDNEAAFATLLNARRLCCQPDELIDLVIDWCSHRQQQIVDLSSEVQTVYGAALMARADQLEVLLKNSPGVEHAVHCQSLMDCLSQAARITAVRTGAIESLARLKFSESPAAKLAATKLVELQVNGDSDASIQLAQGTQAILAGHYAEAIQLLESASVQLRHQNPGLLNNLAIAFVRAENPQPDKALHYIELAEKLLPNYVELKSTRCEILVASRRWDEARTLLEQILPDRPNSAVVHRLMFQVYTELGDDARASAHQSRLQQLTIR